MAKFKKGHSGNPTGRKPGTKNKTTHLAMLLTPHAEDLINKAVELALSGDVQALKLCLERLIPRATSQHFQFDINTPDMEQTQNLSVISRHIINLMLTGNMTPEYAQKFLATLESHRKLIEHSDLIRKIDELEEIYRTKERF
ncbi:DUF5681 domain-containing protein [Legionella bozemanae]|uniref:DUF5681 domain-containing protein n=1 Tax=Legionella bozemanae TaxID=447 RepID=UPI00399CACB9